MSLERNIDEHPKAWALIESLSMAFHYIYQLEAARQAGQGADTVRHPDNYKELPEHTKDYDRALAIYVLDLYERAMDRGHKTFGEFIEQESAALVAAVKGK